MISAFDCDRRGELDDTSDALKTREREALALVEIVIDTDTVLELRPLRDALGDLIEVTGSVFDEETLSLEEEDGEGENRVDALPVFFELLVTV